MTIIVRYYLTEHGNFVSSPGRNKKVRPELKWENDGRGKTWVDKETGIEYSTNDVPFDVNDVEAWRYFLETYVDPNGLPLARFDTSGRLIAYNVWINGGGNKAMRSLFPETKDIAKSGILREFQG